MRRLDIDNATFVRLYREHKSCRVVGSLLGCTGKTVLNRLEEAGVKPGSFGKPPSRSPPNKLVLDEQAVIKHYKGARNLRKTAKRFKCSTPTITKVLEKHGVPRDGKAVYTKDSRKRLSEAIKRTHAEGKMSGEHHWAWRGGKQIATCCICGKKTKRYRISKRPVCSSECNAQRASIDLRIEGLSPRGYPAGWINTLKESIRERDGHACRLCGKSQEDNARLLSTHHIDYDKENLDPRNLLSLCMSCHSKTNRDRARWTRYFKTMIAGRKAG